MRTRTLLPATVLALAAVLTACGGGDDQTAPASSEQSSSSPSASETVPSETAPTSGSTFDDDDDRDDNDRDDNDRDDDGDDRDRDDAPISDADRQRAGDAALEEVGSGRVTDVDRSDDRDHAWDVEVTLDDGRDVDVDLDDDFGVVRVER